MFVTVEQLAEYLHLSPDYIYQQIKVRNIKAIHDGQQYLVNKAHFSEAREKIEQEIIRWKEEQLQEILEDIDIKDED